MKRLVLLFAFLSQVFIFSVAFGNPGDEVSFLDLKPFNSRTNSQWSPILTDIIQHEAPGDSNQYDDKVTVAHETTHGINSYIRNHLNNTGKQANGFYVTGNKAVLIIEPNIYIHDVAPIVPQSLRGDRYSTYISGSSSWDDTPLYIWDEWVAYTNGGEAGVDLVNSGLWNDGWRDAVAGQIEFTVYAIATAMAVKNLDPNYFNTNKQFKEFLAWNLKRSMESFLIGKEMPDFKWDKQDQYYQKLLTSADANALRQFVRDLFGAEWTKEVIGF
jgi:hypothetical protein